MTTSAYNVMGIDPSMKSLGLAVVKPDGSVIAWHDGYSLSRKADDSRGTKRLLYLASFVISTAIEYDVRAFVMEQATFGNVWRVMDLNAVMTTVTTQIYLKFQTVPLLLTTGTFYKYFLGSWANKTNKEALMECLKEKYQYDLANSDEYDAAAMARLLHDNRFASREGLDYSRRMLHKKMDMELRKCGLRPENI